MDGTKTNHQEPAEEMPFTEYEYVKLGTITMMCSIHQIEMIFIDDRKAVCPQCISIQFRVFDLDRATDIINKEKQARIDEEE